MALKDLLDMVPPPTCPAWTGQGEDEWEDAQKELGIRLPHDYRELISVYGGGTFCRTIEIVSPFGPRGLKLFHTSCEQYFRAMASSFPVPQREPRFSVFPDAGGILALGGDELMGYLTWVTEGPPNEWILAWFGDYMEESGRFDMSLADFLVEWVSGRLTLVTHIGQFSDTPLDRTPLFVPTKSPYFRIETVDA